MSQLITTVQVTPSYHQIVVQAEDATDLPVPETGTEQVVASTEAVIVATHDERRGKVIIEVHRGRPADPQGTKVFDGELSLTIPRLVVGSTLGCDTATVDVDRTGWIPITIHADPPDNPNHITVSFNDER